MVGFAVIDVETTGLFPETYDRVAEIAIVGVDDRGDVEWAWSTLVNPGRDLGPQHIHGISATDVVVAPTFDQIAGYVAYLVRGRVPVAHNASFDARFLRAEFARAGWQPPLADGQFVCTMHLARTALPGIPYSLASCCAATGVWLDDAHTAQADALATARLLSRLLGELAAPPAPAPVQAWPQIPIVDHAGVHRGDPANRPTHFLARLTERLTPIDPDSPTSAEYLGWIDRALLDRHLSAREHDALSEVATHLGIDRSTAVQLHHQYLTGLASAAWADGVITDEERHDLNTVAALLGLSPADVDESLTRTHPTTMQAPNAPTDAPRFALSPGDRIVFTGDMAIERSHWHARCVEHGYQPVTSVSRKVALVVAADPDSLSGKARKAADLGIPIVTEHAFTVMLVQG